ncbi:MAG: putative prephenate dehydratase [Rickettsiales bacterium]|nr:putative prephenate dehydratase [Rickettsiales bacterium]
MKAPSNNIIAFQGVRGAHADMACRQAYPYMDTMPLPSFEDVFQAVQEGKAALGMLPIENSQAGRVAEIHNLLPRMHVSIVGEYFQRIEHHLLAPKGATLQTVKNVYSHPQALMQCRGHTREMGLEAHHASNTAIAAEEVARWNDPSKGALASALAAELYGLTVLKPNMEDSNENTTIFVTIASEPIDTDPETQRIVTSLLFTARNIPAALYKALGGFATNHVNLLKLESYIPGGASDRAQFFVTFEGHPQERNVQLALEELGFFCRNVKVLGVYPADPKRFG